MEAGGSPHSLSVTTSPGSRLPTAHSVAASLSSQFQTVFCHVVFVMIQLQLGGWGGGGVLGGGAEGEVVMAVVLYSLVVECLTPAQTVIRRLRRVRSSAEGGMSGGRMLVCRVYVLNCITIITVADPPRSSM